MESTWDLLACKTIGQGLGKPNTDTLGPLLVLVPVPVRPNRGAIYCSGIAVSSYLPASVFPADLL
jgi:hypothetical protein